MTKCYFRNETLFDATIGKNKQNIDVSREGPSPLETSKFSLIDLSPFE
jgi:hypothetical protein